MMDFHNLKNTGVSVVIACYNGKDRINETLRHLAGQKEIDFPLEILLVDNNSTDGTASVAMHYWHKAGDKNVPLTVVVEKKAGTMHARYKGMIEANYRYLLFVDDDNHLHGHYIKTAYDLINKDPGIAAVGGKGILFGENGSTPPVWIQQFDKSFGCGDQGKRDGDTTHDKGCLYTGGTVFDRVWLARLYAYGFKSILTGRTGKNLVAGEDTELTYALKLIGGKLHYNASMHFMHVIPARRLNWKHLQKLWFAFGYSDFVLYPYLIHFKKKYKQFWLKRLYCWTKVLILCTYKYAIQGFKPGNIYKLRLNRTLGEINAFATNYKAFRNSQKNLETLYKAANNQSKIKSNA